MALSYKDIEVDGNIFRCDGVWTVRVAREEIRDCYSLQGGGILSTETGVRVPGDVVIGTLTGALSFVGGQRAVPTQPVAAPPPADSTFAHDNLARVMLGVKKINTPSAEINSEDMRTAFYLGMGRLKSSPSTARLCHLWATARHSTLHHGGIVTDSKGQLSIKSETSVEFTCLYDCEKTDLAILGCESISNVDLHVHEFGNALFVGENLKLAGFGQSLERANPFVPSVKSVNVALTNCSIFDSDEPAEHVGWKSFKFFVVDQVVDFGYTGSPVYHPTSCEVIGMVCGSFEDEFANASMCLKAHYIADALTDHFVLKRKRTFSTEL